MLSPGVAGAATTGGAASQAAATPSGGYAAASGTLAATPIRPPAAPLAVRNPYVSTWLPATALPATWEQFWQGHTTAMGGIARVDGVSYMFMGDPGIILTIPDGNHGTPSTTQGFQQALQQTKLEVTPTRSRFTLEGGGIELTVEFLSPVEPGDTKRQSIPFSYLILSARSIDGHRHDVQLYADISGEWCSADDSQQITWAAVVGQLSGRPPAGVVGPAGQPAAAHRAEPAGGLGQHGVGHPQHQRAELPVRPGRGGPGPVRQQRQAGRQQRHHLPGHQDNWPVFAFCADLGQLGGSARTVPLSIGLARTPAVSYQGQNLDPWWSKEFSSWPDMLGFFHGDLAAAQRRATTLDNRITSDARAAGGTAYAGLCAIALRQAYGGTELVAGPDGSPWAFLKEISSDGNVSTVDVMFPASPVWVYADPGYLALLLTPLVTYAESGKWPEQFAPHDLGSSYPVADGHNDGGGENMPVEETGNMLIMAAAYIQQVPSAARAYATAHYKIFKQWADYLVANLPDPGFQNQTDDFAGQIAHSVNLALKGIVAVAAFGQIATAAGNSADAASYTAQAKQFIATWVKNAQDPSAPHLDLTYSGDDGGNGTWGTTYNGFADRLLGTNLVPASVLAEQAAWYPKVSNLFGLPLQVPHSYAKSDWELWTAAWLSNYPVSKQLIEQVYTYANTTPQRVPFSDLYDTIAGTQTGFQARPVQGGIFALLALRNRR